jgi:hypothetical protein
VLDVETQHVAKPGYRTRQIAIPNPDMVDASGVK